tara:strand:+ start:1524 stop:1730 length:207 start_codon:yes stop_codon:yes gene_type:complete
MATPYKMKGSPMQRNFGAPFRKEKLTKVTDGKGKVIKKSEEKKEELNEFGETNAQYIARVKSMGLRND